jgi:hypothetical protein
MGTISLAKRALFGSLECFALIRRLMEKSSGNCSVKIVAIFVSLEKTTRAEEELERLSIEDFDDLRIDFKFGEFSGEGGGA